MDLEEIMGGSSSKPTKAHAKMSMIDAEAHAKFAAEDANEDDVDADDLPAG